MAYDINYSEMQLPCDSVTVIVENVDATVLLLILCIVDYNKQKGEHMNKTVLWRKINVLQNLTALLISHCPN